MEEKNSQENAIEPIEPIEKIEKIEPIETIETAIDIKSLSSETKSDILSRTKQHRENVDKIIVPQYIDDQYVEDKNYVVTYSNYFTYRHERHDNSIPGWTINIEENGQQQPDVYFKLDQKYTIESSVLYKKTLLFCYYDESDRCYRKYLF
jgi:hypothetical protein